MTPVDQRVNEIEAEVVGLKVAVNAIDEKIDRQTQVITDVVRGGKTNPATQIGFATFFLALVIFYNDLTARPIMQSIDYNKTTAETSDTLLAQRVDIKIEGLNDDIAALWHYFEKHTDNKKHGIK